MAERYRVVILPEASADLTGICDYTASDSPANARVVARKLVEAIDSLERFPHRHKVHGSRRNPEHVVRSMPVAPFIIYD